MEKEEGEGGPSVRNIQTYNAPGPRRYIGINLWGLRGGRPARLYIRSDRVEYLALLCPVHISALPPLCLYHPPSRRPSLAVASRGVAPFCDCVSRVFVSARSCALHDTSAIECSAEQEPLFSATDECLPRNARPFELITHNARLRERGANW